MQLYFSKILKINLVDGSTQMFTDHYVTDHSQEELEEILKEDIDNDNSNTTDEIRHELISLKPVNVAILVKDEYRPLNLIDISEYTCGIKENE